MEISVFIFITIIVVAITVFLLKKLIVILFQLITLLQPRKLNDLSEQTIGMIYNPDTQILEADQAPIITSQ